jgi:RimJ/RimL family protein N-acetyltransferase
MAVFENSDGFMFGLRSVKLSDAESIVRIRSGDPIRSKFLNAIPSDPQIQRTYIRSQRLKEDDYYFRISNLKDEVTEGFIGLYSVSCGSAEWGRWVVAPGSISALESVYLILDFGFQKLGLTRVYCNTLSENTSTLSFHDTFGFRRAGETEIVVDHGIVRTAITHEMTKSQWGSSEPRHRSLIQRLARTRK